MSPEKRDLGATLIAAAVLVFATGYLAQCSSPVHRSEPVTSGASPAAESQGEHEVTEERNSGREHDEEESAKIKSVGRALQTIGANPEMRQTYGFPP